MGKKKKITEDEHLNAAWYTRQIPVNDICRDIPEATCIEYNLLDYTPNGAYIDTVVGAIADKAKEGVAAEDEQDNIRNFAEQMVLDLRGLNNAGVASFCAEDTLDKYGDEHLAEECYCVDFGYKEKEAKGTTSERAKTESAPSTESDGIGRGVDLRDTVIGDSTFNTSTHTDVEEHTIPTHFGTVVVTGDVIGLDIPYATVSSAYTPEDAKQLTTPFTQPASTNKGINFGVVAGLDNTNSKLKPAKPPVLEKTIVYKTNALISLGAAASPVTIRSVFVNGAALPEANYRLLTPGTFVNDGDLNAARFMPGYKDLTVLLLEGINTDSTLDVRAVVSYNASPVNNNPFTAAASPLATPGTRFLFNNLSMTYADTATSKLKHVSLVNPYGAAPASYDMPFPVSFQPNTKHWTVAKDGDIVYYKASATAIVKYNIATGLSTTIIDNMPFPPDLFAYGNNVLVTNVGSTIKVIANAAGTTNIAYPPGTVFDRAIVVDNTFIDIFVNGYSELWRLELTGNVSITKFNLHSATGVQNVAHTSRFYMVFSSGGADVYTADSMTYVGRLNIPDTLGTVLATDRYAEKPFVYALVVGATIYTLNLRDMTVTTNSIPDIALSSPKAQMYDNGGIFCVCTDNVIRNIATNITTGTSNPISVGQVLTALGYKKPDHFDKSMIGFTALEHKQAVTDLINVYEFPRSSQASSVNTSAVQDKQYTIKAHVNTYPFGYSKLTYNTLDPLSQTLTDEVAYLPDAHKADSVILSARIQATYTYEQAYLANANFYNYQKKATDEITVNTRSLREEYGDTIKLANGKVYTIYDYAIREGGVIEYRARASALPEITQAPAPHKDVLAKPDALSVTWDFTGTKLYHIPIVIEPGTTSQIVYMGEAPTAICVGGDCSITPPTSPCVMFGQLVQPMPHYVGNTRAFDTRSTFSIAFGFDITGSLTAATYDELLLDTKKNLLFIGYEAVQFTDFVLEADGKTVTFSGLLRGRFNTTFFSNYHKSGEMCFVYDPTTMIDIATATNTFTLSVDDTKQNTTAVRNDIHGYTGTVEVLHIDRGADNNTVEITTGSLPSDATLYLSKSPLIWQQKTHNIFHAGEIVTGGANTITVPHMRYGPVYWMVTAPNNFPDYGVITSADTGERVYTNKVTQYAVLDKRDTNRLNKESAYAAIVL